MSAGDMLVLHYWVSPRLFLSVSYPQIHIRPDGTRMALYPQIALVSPVYPGWYWRMKLASWFGSPVVGGLLSGNPDKGN